MNSAAVGLCLDLGLQLNPSASCAEVKKHVLRHFDADLGHNIELFTMHPLEPHEAIGQDANLVVKIPGTLLNLKTVEELANDNNYKQNEIIELKIEINQLKKRLAHSEAIRRDALETVDMLRREFIGLFRELSPKLSRAIAASSAKSVREYPNGLSARQSSRHKQLPNLTLNNIRP